MRKSVVASVVVAVVGLILFTALLALGLLGGTLYCGLITVLSFVSLAIAWSGRISEVDFKKLRLTLQEIRTVQADVERLKAEVIEMYGGIDHIRRAPLVLDDAKRTELGLSTGHLATADATMRYAAGVVKRERERLAKVFVNAKNPQQTAEAILDGSLDDKVFRWCGPEHGIDDSVKLPAMADEKKLTREKR